MLKKATLKLCLCLVFLLLCSLANAKPFKRAMYFNGGGLDFTKFVGMYFGAKDAGKKPDLIVGICGGSLAASIVASFNTQEEALAFLTSPEMHSMFLSVGTTKWAKTPNAVGLIISMAYKKLVNSQRRAGIKDKFIIDVPQKLNLQEFKKPIQAREDLSVIIPTTMILGTEEGKLPPRKKDWKFQAVYYTDPKTAQILKENDLLKPFFKTDYPNAPVMDEIITKTGVLVEDAFRGSISDPFLMEPHFYDNHLHLTGAMDASPLEMISGLADEVFYLTSQPFTGLQATFFKDAFQFDPNLRIIRQEMQKQGKYAYYLDLLQFPTKNSLSLGLVGLKSGIKSYVPQDYNEFRRRILYQFEAGYKAARDAVTNAGSLRHVTYDSFAPLRGYYRKFAKKFVEKLPAE